MRKKNTLSSARPFLYGILGLALLNLCLFGDILLFNEGSVLSSPQADLFHHFVAWRQFAFEQLRAGHLVLWNPHYLCGAPFFGGFEAALLYPPNWLYLVLPLVAAINVGIILHIFMAGLFTYFWAYRRGLHSLACLVSGTVFMFGGAYYLHLFAGHLPNLCTMVWAPLIFLAIDGLVEKSSWRWILLGIFAVSMQILAGHPQYVYFTAIIAMIYTVLNLWGNKQKLKILMGAAGIYTGASLMTAVQLWTGIEAFLECGRNIPLEYLSASSFSFPPQNLLTLVLPDFFGSLSLEPYWSQWFLWEVSLFTGTTAFFLVLVAAISAKSSNRKWAITISVIAFLLALGTYTPLYHLLYDFFPLFKGMRGISKFGFLISLFLALLAGIGIDHLIKAPKAPHWPVSLTICSGFLLMILGYLVFESTQKGPAGFWAEWLSSIHWLKNAFQTMEPQQKSSFIQAAGLHSASSLFWGSATCLLLALLFFACTKTKKAVYAIAALSVLELFIFARNNRPTFEMAALQKKIDQVRDIYTRDPGDYRVYGTASISLAANGFDIWEDEPMVLGRYGQFVCRSQGLSENQLFSVLPIYQKFLPLFGVLRLRYRVSVDEEPVKMNPTGYPLLPRMALLNHWEVITDPQKSLAALFQTGFDPTRKVILERDPDLASGAPLKGGKVEWRDLSTDSVEVTVDIQGPAILLITDNYSSGWKAKALPDSAQKKYNVVPADYFLQGVPLSAGKHHLRLDYLPHTFQVGKWVSILFCLLYVGILMLHLKGHPLLK